MKSKKITGSLLSLAFLSVFAVFVVAEISPDKAAPSTLQKPTATGPQDNQVKEKLKDNTFVEQATLSGLAEVEFSKLVISKSENQKLKRYASVVLKEQAESNAKLQQVATQSRIDTPEKLNPEYLKIINELKSLSGEEFDRAIINILKKNQDTTVALYDNAAGEPTLSVDLRVFANQSLPSLREEQQNTHALIQTN
jgi:putative membrane protein